MVRFLSLKEIDNKTNNLLEHHKVSKRKDIIKKVYGANLLPNCAVCFNQAKLCLRLDRDML